MQHWNGSSRPLRRPCLALSVRPALNCKPTESATRLPPWHRWRIWMKHSPISAATELLRRRGLRRHLADWGRYKGFEPAPHHAVICQEIDTFLDSDEEVLLLFAPPGLAKSTWLSALFPAQYLARFPKNSILP